MKIHRMVQGSDEWLSARAGIPTASEFSNLVTPAWKARTGEMVETYLSKKLAERWRGEPLPGWGGGSLEQGSLREEEAIPYFEVQSGLEVERVGFITTDDGRWGCSPDGMLKGRNGLEVKCPEPHTQIRYLLAGVLPAAYATQVQGSMLVTQAQAWTFFSYCRGLPDLILTVNRDEKAIAALAEALTSFCERLDEGYARLVSLYGGPPPTTADDESGSLGF